MKREGKQNGTVSPHNPRKGNDNDDDVDFTRWVPTKFTGKCNRPRCTGCHLHPPSWKAKNKTKGGRKPRASDLDMGYGGLLVWHVNKAEEEWWYPDYKMKLDMYSAHEILYELADVFDEFVIHNPYTWSRWGRHPY